MLRVLTAVVAISMCCVPVSAAQRSICRGTPEKGVLENGCKLPNEGRNFTTYSSLGSAVGRTYVHCAVASTLLSAHEELATTRPNLRFVYGESGWRSGGRFRPHKTHQNGLSVDFFAPVRNSANESVYLPTGVTNKWGYAIEFDQKGRFGEFTIDFEAMAEHLLVLEAAARKNGIGIRRVIFDPQLQPLLRQTRQWRELRSKVKFSTGRSWVRHDEHYHVDFAVACERL